MRSTACARASRSRASETETAANGQTVASGIGATLELLAEVLREPAFPAAEFETLKRERLAALQAERQSPEAVSLRALGRYANPYPPGDVRYVPTLDEEVRTLSATTVDDVRNFHRQFAGGSTAELAIVGDFDPADVRPRVTALFGDWRSATPFERVPRPLVKKPPTSIGIETPDKANAALFGHQGFALRDTDPDFVPLLIANRALGAGPASRLWSRVREKAGLSYGVGSSFEASSFEPRASVSLSATFAPQNLDRLRSAIADELSRAVDSGFSDTEVAQSKESLLRQRQLARTQDASLAAMLIRQDYLGRRFDFDAGIDAAIAAATPSEVNAALRKHVRPDAFAYAYGGDFTKVQ